MEPVEAEVLRVHPEPCRHVTDEQVHRALTADPDGYLAHLEAVLGEIAAGAAELEHPEKLVFDDGPDGGDFRVMPCVVRRPEAEPTKTVKVVGTNVTEVHVPDQVTVGKALRLDPADNFVSHLFDACLLSSARTGACGVLALRRLAPAATRVGLVGAGRVAFYTGLYAAASGAGELRLFDRRAERARRLADALDARLAGVAVRAVDRLGAVDGDAVVLATTSREPVCGPDDLGTPVVVSLGADTADQRELTAGWAQAASLYVDSGDALAIGDLRAWRREGVELDGRPVRLLSLFRGTPAAAEGRRVFVSTGAALFDNLTVSYLLGDGPGSIDAVG